MDKILENDSKNRKNIIINVISNELECQFLFLINQNENRILAKR